MSEEGNRLNLIFISVDSLRYDAITAVHTPNLLRLSETAGCLFDEMIVQAPFTVPSHASMLTGLYPFNHHLRRFSGQKLHPTAQTLFNYLRRRDYEIVVRRDVAVFGAEHGYSPAHFQAAAPPTLPQLRRILSRRRERPFCLFIHYWGVHTPYDALVPVQNWRDAVYNLIIHLQSRLGLRLFSLTPTQPYWLERLEKVRNLLRSGQATPIIEGYHRALRRFDGWLAGLFKLLRRRPLRDNTLVIVTSDHGECFNEHDEAARYPHSYEHGLFLFENAVRVPALFVGPNIPAGRRITEQVESVDLVPTIYQLLGFTGTSDSGYLPLDGRSLVPRWQENAPGKPLTYSETLRRGGYQAMGRGKRYKLIQDRINDREWLFDLQRDPGENDNLRERYPEVRKRLTAALTRFENAARHNMPAASPVSAAETAQVQRRLRMLGYAED